MSAKLKEIIRINKVERLIWCIIFHKRVTAKFFSKLRDRAHSEISISSVSTPDLRFQPARNPNRFSISGLSDGNRRLSIRKLVRPAISLNKEWLSNAPFK